MLNQAPYYYKFSNLYNQIQAAQASEYDSIEEAREDLRKQFYITTATWGLKYWEELLNIPTNESDSYDVRRSRVLSRWRAVGNFSEDLIKSVCESFLNGEVDVKIRPAQYEVIIKFVGKRGIPPNLEDLKAIVNGLIHAHYGVSYEFTYLIWDEVDKENMTFDELDAANYTFDELEVARPPLT